MVKKRLRHIICLLLFGYLSSCTEEVTTEKGKRDTTLFTSLSAEETGIDFVNEVSNSKELNIFRYRNFYNGGGVGIGDINNDGLADVYFTANMKGNKLYLNKGDLTFEDVTEPSGTAGSNTWSTGVVMVDINADGWLDIYVCNAGNVEGDNQKNELFINNHDGTFTEKAEAYNLADSGTTTHTAFFDYDRDGDLDAYILNNSFIPVSSLQYVNKRELRAKDWDLPDILKGGGDRLLRNDHGKFTDVSEVAGIYGSLIGFGLGVTVGDINDDLLPDIYVSNDFYERDYLYINQGDGTFKEDIKNWAAHLSLSSMGADMADINNDGRPDIFVTDMLPEGDERLKNTTTFETYDIYQLKLQRDFYHQYMQNTLHLNNGNRSFSEVAYYGGVAKTDWSWGALMFDMDNDGYRDIYVCNGIYHDLTDQDFMDFFANEIIQDMVVSGKKEEVEDIVSEMPSRPIPNYAFQNKGDLTFVNMAEAWGVGTPSFSNGAAYGDLDNDGDLDLVVNNVNMQAFVFKNESNPQSDHHFLKIALEGVSPNTFGIGSIVELHVGEEILRQEMIPSRGFQSSIDYTMTLGLGSHALVDSLRVIWPDGKTQLLREVSVDKKLTLRQIDALESYNIDVNMSTPLFVEVSARTPLSAHQENFFVDFDREGLIYQMLSKEGPTIAMADVDGDGNEDIFLGGAKGYNGQLLTNKGEGTFQTTPWVYDAALEDTSSAFFDADGDGDQDLMVGSGGNEGNEDISQYKNRLYLNDGKGKFSKSAQQIPTSNNNSSVIAPYDFDDDGDIDVFVGSRSVPGIFGIDPAHLFLENDGIGNFKDATQSKAFATKNGGMIGDAIWVDINGDDKKDLLTVGEWSAPTFYTNDGKRLRPYATSLDSLKGFWNTVRTADLDGDGDQDLILGNKGTNTAYKASKTRPMRLYVNDFDHNGTIEQITTRTLDGRDMPIQLKRELTNQLVSLKKENLKFSEYATRSIDELFSAEVVANSIVKEVNYMESVVALNEGNGTFMLKPLPREVQFSCVCDIACMDVDKNGTKDIVLGGNQYELKPQYSRLDANYGGVLLGNGKGDFEWQPYTKSGFFVRGATKHIQPFSDKDGRTYLLVGLNNEVPKIYRINE